MIIFYQFRFEKFIETICFDIDCTMFLINKQFLIDFLFDVVIHQIFHEIIVRNIDNKIHKYEKYVKLNFYVFDIFAEQFMLIHIIRNVHFVDEFKIKLFIDMNIIKSKQINIDILIRKFVLKICRKLLINFIITFKTIKCVH